MANNAATSHINVYCTSTVAQCNNCDVSSKYSVVVRSCILPCKDNHHIMCLNADFCKKSCTVKQLLNFLMSHLKLSHKLKESSSFDRFVQCFTQLDETGPTAQFIQNTVLYVR